MSVYLLFKNASEKHDTMNDNDVFFQEKKTVSHEVI